MTTRRTSTRIVVAGCALAALVLAGCANTQPGDRNTGRGYTNDVSDLLVKVPALQGDPCRGKQADQLFPSCGRYVTEVANTVSALRTDLPAQSTETNTLQNAVTSYQRSGCDTAGTSPTVDQRNKCPRALAAIGAELDQLSKALDSLPTSR